MPDADRSTDRTARGDDEQQRELTFVDPAGSPLARLPFYILPLDGQLRRHVQKMSVTERRGFNDCMAPTVMERGQRLETDFAGKAVVSPVDAALAVAAWEDDLAGLHVLTPTQASQPVTIRMEPAQVAEIRIAGATTGSSLPVAIDWLLGDELIGSHSLGLARSGTLTFPWVGVLRASIPDQEPNRARFRIDLPGAPASSEVHPANQVRLFAELEAPSLTSSRTFAVVDAARAARPTFRGRCDVRNTAGHQWVYPIQEGRCEIPLLADGALDYLVRDSKGRIVGAAPLPRHGDPDLLVTNRQTVIQARLEGPTGSPLEEGSMVTIQAANDAAESVRLGTDGRLRHSLAASEGTKLRLEIATPATPLVARTTIPTAQAGLCDLGTLRLHPPEVSLRVLVTDPTGRPLPDAELTVRQHNRELETRPAEAASFLVFAADLDAPVFLSASAPAHTTTLVESVGETRLTMIIEPAAEHEIVLELPEDISPRGLTAVLVTDHAEHVPDEVETADRIWRGKWHRAPRVDTRLRILARCPARVVHESPVKLGDDPTRITPHLGGWRGAEVSIERYRHWGVYVAPLERTGTLSCTEVVPGDPLVVREAEELLFFGPKLMGILCATRNAGTSIELDFAASPRAVPAKDASQNLRAHATCTHPLLRHDLVVEAVHWPDAGTQPVREPTHLGAILGRAQETGELHFPFAYDVTLVDTEGKTRHRARIEPPFRDDVVIAGESSSGR